MERTEGRRIKLGAGVSMWPSSSAETGTADLTRHACLGRGGAVEVRERGKAVGPAERAPGNLSVIAGVTIIWFSFGMQRRRNCLYESKVPTPTASRMGSNGFLSAFAITENAVCDMD